MADAMQGTIDGMVCQWQRQLNAATRNEAMKSSPDRATTPFCVVRSSLFLRRLLSSSGDLQNITIPIIIIGMNNMPIKSHPLCQQSVPAGRNSNTPKSTTPATYFVRADISSFIVLCVEKDVLQRQLFLFEQQ